jgi:hypothetical protein
MKNLSFQIKGNQVIFKIILNTISYYSTSDFVSEEFCQNLIDKAFRYERLLSEINEANDWLYLEQLIVYSEDNLPLISFELNKGKRLRPEEKETILAEIKTSIQEQKPFTSLSLFEMRVHDLEFFEYSYFIDKLEIRNLYQYQIFHKQYLKA